MFNIRDFEGHIQNQQHGKIIFDERTKNQSPAVLEKDKIGYEKLFNIRTAYRFELRQPSCPRGCKTKICSVKVLKVVVEKNRV